MAKKNAGWIAGRFAKQRRKNRRLLRHRRLVDAEARTQLFEAIQAKCFRPSLKTRLLNLALWLVSLGTLAFVIWSTFHTR